MKTFRQMLEEKNQSQSVLDENMLFEMANIKKRDHPELPVNIYVSENPKVGHSARIKFQNNRTDRLTSMSDLIPMIISKNPIIPDEEDYNIKLKSKELNLIKKWIILNYDNLMLLWNNKISEEKFLKVAKYDIEN